MEIILSLILILATQKQNPWLDGHLLSLRTTLWAPAPDGRETRLATLTWMMRWILLMIMEASMVTEEMPGSRELLAVLCFFSSSTCRDKPFLSHLKWIYGCRYESDTCKETFHCSFCSAAGNRHCIKWDSSQGRESLQTMQHRIFKTVRQHLSPSLSLAFSQ